MAPEIIRRVPYNEKVDIWSLGVMVYIMLSGRPPYIGKTKNDIFNQATTCTIKFDEEIWGKISKEAKNFIKQMLVRDPKKRASASELL